MKIEEFNLLSEFNKYDIVFTKGTFSTYKLRGNTKLVYYPVFDFYTIIKYNISKNEILGITSFKNKYSLTMGGSVIIKYFKMHL